MESLENKIIADKLNSLQELPVGYAPNIASKWEIIQSGLPAKSSSSPAKKWLLGILFLLLVAILVWILMPAQNKDVFVENNIAQKQVTKQINIEKSEVEPKNEDVQTKETFVTKKQIPVSKNKRHDVHKPTEIISQPVKPVNINPGTFLRKQPDTIKFQAPIAATDLNPKKRIYQRDFESMVTSVDTLNRKTAQKGFQIKFSLRNNKETETNRQPSLRLQQNF